MRVRSSMGVPDKLLKPYPTCAAIRAIECDDIGSTTCPASNLTRSRGITVTWLLRRSSGAAYASVARTLDGLSAALARRGGVARGDVTFDAPRTRPGAPRHAGPLAKVELRPVATRERSAAHWRDRRQVFTSRVDWAKAARKPMTRTKSLAQISGNRSRGWAPPGEADSSDDRRSGSSQRRNTSCCELL